METTQTQLIRCDDAHPLGSYSGVIAGIEWAVDNGMDVASMSLGGSSGTDALLEACDAARDNGTIIVAAAGNSGGSVGYPAAYDSCITVGAVDKRNKLASFSSRGPELDVVAPGVNVYSTYKNGYKKLSGTSMATPHVSGFVALLKQQDMSRGFGDIRTILHENSTDLGDPGFNEEYGYGLIDAIKALGL
ncbi:MAG: S8 family serine peptidase [Methanopyri archaeon]|nr:S8 family serine peptidase [Methanopyri archaeon]